MIRRHAAAIAALLPFSMFRRWLLDATDTPLMPPAARYRRRHRAAFAATHARAQAER